MVVRKYTLKEQNLIRNIIVNQQIWGSSIFRQTHIDILYIHIQCGAPLIAKLVNNYLCSNHGRNHGKVMEYAR